MGGAFMKRISKLNFLPQITFTTIMFIFLIILPKVNSFACTSVLAGKNATVDGSVMIARNEDQYNAWGKKFVVHNRQTSSSPVIYKSTDNGFEYPIGTLSYKYTATPDWNPYHGIFEEAGINEYQVAVSATQSVDNNEIVQKIDPFNSNTGITESSIPSVLLPQIKSAREGVMLMGKIIDTLGAGEAFGMSIADTKEAWYLECGSAHEWVAVRVPDNCYMIVANQIRINHVNLKDSSNYLGSSNIIAFAEKNHLYKTSEGAFNFAKIFGTDNNDDYVYNYPRVWWGEKMLTPSANLKAGGNNYPLFLKPDKRLSPVDIMSVLRSHYNDTEFDSVSESYDINNPRPINVNFTEESHILQLRGWLPNPIGGVQWLLFGVPESSVYVRFYSGITDTPNEYKLGTDKYDDTSAYWDFRSLSALVNTHYIDFSPTVISSFNDFEKKEFDEQTVTDINAIKLYKNNVKDCYDYLTNYSNNLAISALKLAKDLESQIITNITNEPKQN